MKQAWLQYLCDPADGSPLALKEVAQRAGERIRAGSLIGESGRTYPIRNGIPVFLDAASQSLASVESFTYEWNEFGFLYAREGWVKDVVLPLVGGPGTSPARRWSTRAPARARNRAGWPRRALRS